MRKLIIEAYSCDEFSDSPAFAIQAINDEFLARIQSMQDLCLKNGLSECSASIDHTLWDCGEELKLTCQQLVVGHSVFKITAFSEKAGCEVKTQHMLIYSLFAALNDSGKDIYYGNNVEVLREMVTDTK